MREFDKEEQPKTIRQQVKDYREHLADEIILACEEFELDTTYYHIYDLVRILRNEKF